MSRRRTKRRGAKSQAPRPSEARTAQRTIVREATRVERLVYTRTQAAEALGLGRSTFNRRVLPLIETIEMPWGIRLIPADELERLIAERRRPARENAQRPGIPGRRPQSRRKSSTKSERNVTPAKAWRRSHAH